MRVNKRFVQGRENIGGQGYYFEVRFLRDLGSLEFEVKHSGKYSGNVGVKGFVDLREKPIRASVFMRFKAAQSTSDFQFSNVRFSHAGLYTWLEYGG